MKLETDCVVMNRENEANHGKAGDYLAPDGYGGYYVIGKEFYDNNYERVVEREPSLEKL